MKKTKNNYINVIYNSKDRPYTKYPSKLIKYLIKRYELNKGSSILDFGCGRGEFLECFVNNGLVGFGTDQSDFVNQYSKNIKFKSSDFEKEGIPFPDNYFDYVFSKSVIEHFYNPEKFGNEVYRVLKPGGKLITMCPAWEFNYKMFYDDYTHRTPFSKISLSDFLLINGFVNVECEYFRQLPIIWKFKILILFSELTRLFFPNFLKKRSKWVRFSKEIMLLSSSNKPFD